MTERSFKPPSDVEAEQNDPSPEDRRDRIIKVFVNKTEKAELQKQKGRLSFSAFLRDRGLTRGDVYDPTYAAIGGVYQSARNLRDSAELLEQASIALQKSATAFVSSASQNPGVENSREGIEDLRGLATQLQAGAERMGSQAETLGGQARELGQKHMNEMLERYPAKDIVPRKGR
ncbi:MAG: hypothetical protein V2I43_05955 [Parvularcula sp.]|jgi:hypothetical protein|nr:hypothetical protein [Parvularcula sp.]